MRLVFICEAVFPENKGGLERWFQALTKEIAKEGNDVVYLNASGINEVRGGVTYISVTSKTWFYLSGGVRSIRQSIEFAIKVFNFLRKNEYDGVYCAQAPILSIYSTLLIKLFKKRTTIIEWFEVWPLKYWIRYSGIPLGAIGWTVQLIASQFGSHLTVFTPRAKNALRVLRFGRDKRITILNGLLTRSDDLMIDGSSRNDIIFLGRLVDEKQPQLAIEAVTLYLNQGWTGEFWLIGQGPLGDSLANSINSSEFGRNIHVIQNASDEFVQSKMQKSFLMLHPSRREGYGISIVEAATQGVPALLIDYADNAAVDLKINPRLVSKYDKPQDLVRLIEFADVNQESLRRETQEWIQYASENQTMEKSSYQIRTLFEASRTYK
jgi:glycosyltransferase involved in cell wall biosynthesis